MNKTNNDERGFPNKLEDGTNDDERGFANTRDREERGVGEGLGEIDVESSIMEVGGQKLSPLSVFVCMFV